MQPDIIAALGRDFDAAPPHWVPVFRECSPEELRRIAAEGLVVPPPELRPLEIRREMEVLDRFRPPHIIERGISRLGAIYAVPAPEDAPRLPFRKERVILEFKIDPAAAFVGDMDFITGLIPFISAHAAGLEQYRGAFHRYWESVIPFTEFNCRYARQGTDAGGQWVCRRQSRNELPKNYFAPEILIMTPVVSQRHIRMHGA